MLERQSWTLGSAENGCTVILCFAGLMNLEQALMCTPSDRHTEKADNETDRPGKKCNGFFDGPQNVCYENTAAALKDYSS